MLVIPGNGQGLLLNLHPGGRGTIRGVKMLGIEPWSAMYKLLITLPTDYAIAQVISLMYFNCQHTIS